MRLTVTVRPEHSGPLSTTGSTTGPSEQILSADMGTAEHVSDLMNLSNLEVIWVEHTALIWQSERPQWPLSAPVSKRVNAATSLL